MEQREEPTQQTPAAGLDLSTFPRRLVPQCNRWRRAHLSHYDPWHFASGPGGRFNLTSPLGTCYFANTAEGAAREVIGPVFTKLRFVPVALIHDRVISEVALPWPVTSAKLTSDDAFAFGITNELMASSTYQVSRAWAAAIYDAGFDGIWYQPRFSPGKGRALAVFGDVGDKPGTVLTSVPMRSVIDSMPGIRVIGGQALDEFHILDDPTR